MPDKRKRRNCTEEHIIKIMPKWGGITTFEIQPETYGTGYKLRLRISTPYVGDLELEHDKGDILVYFRSAHSGERQ